ncbi:hypothetical protein SBF1_9590002 [Candidatus Desulfosporosinus infrequens]|uniref:Uncharacterized protein n=1 Tax=Candidatus Desulfosporosinus infrequens TaxID=2043169 RepID=A0A2U3LYQ8_9FIRM|nr:hypothetical protein SBF1_9590002 [Candidatus Desulfosporosinus infrequens]
MANEVEMKKTLGLTGVTVNAMALIAPGAFLWLTFQMQAAQVDTAGNSTAADMFSGLILVQFPMLNLPSSTRMQAQEVPITLQNNRFLIKKSI